MDKNMTAEKLWQLFEEMENKEKWKFLAKMYNKHFCKDGVPINEEDIGDY